MYKLVYTLVYTGVRQLYILFWSASVYTTLVTLVMTLYTGVYQRLTPVYNDVSTCIQVYTSVSDTCHLVLSVGGGYTPPKTVYTHL